MKILVGYASKEGQSRKIARFVADRIIDAGHSAEVLALEDAEDIELGRFDRAVLAASIHVGHFKASLAEFAKRNVAWLATHPVLFLPVSLAAAGHDAEDWRGLATIAKDLEDATGWAPSETVQVAGAYVPSKYDLFTRFIMRRIIAEKNPDADLKADLEYTDWTALGETVDDWVAR